MTASTARAARLTRPSWRARLGLSLAAVATVGTVALAPGLVQASETAPIMGAVALHGSQALLGASALELPTQVSTLPDSGRLELPRSVATPRFRLGWIAGGTLGLVGGALLTTGALSVGATPNASLSGLVAEPSSYPLLTAGASSLAIGYLAARVGVHRAGRGDRRGPRFELRPQVSLAVDSVSVGFGGRF